MNMQAKANHDEFPVQDYGVVTAPDTVRLERHPFLGASLEPEKNSRDEHDLPSCGWRVAGFRRTLMLALLEPAPRATPHKPPLVFPQKSLSR